MQKWKLTALIRAFSLFKIPLLGVTRPKVICLDSQKSIVRLPINRLTKNHLGSMYFGALAMGAELSVALRVVDRIMNEKTKVNFIFKDFQCQFLKRAETDVDFCFFEVALMNQLVDQALQSKERVSQEFQGFAIAATDMDHENTEKLMTYKITISLKAK